MCLADPILNANLLPHLAALVADAAQLRDNPPRLASFLIDPGGGRPHDRDSSSSSVDGGGPRCPVARGGGEGFAMGMCRRPRRRFWCRRQHHHHHHHHHKSQQQQQQQQQQQPWPVELV